MNFCPPNPGFTLISSTISTLSITYLRQSSEVAGLKTRPDLHPAARTRLSERSMWSVASGWNVMKDAPASANLHHARGQTYGASARAMRARCERDLGTISALTPR